MRLLIAHYHSCIYCVYPILKKQVKKIATKNKIKTLTNFKFERPPFL